MLNQNKISNHLCAGQAGLKALKLIQSLNMAEKSYCGDLRVWQIIVLSLALPLSKTQKINFKTHSGWKVSQQKTFWTTKTFLTHFWPALPKKTNLFFKSTVGSGCALNTFSASKPLGSNPETKSHVSMLLAELVNQHEALFKNSKKTVQAKTGLILLGGVVKTQNQRIFITYDEIEQALKLQKLGLNIHKTTLKQTRAVKLSPFQSVLKHCLTCLNLRRIRKTSLS